MKENIINFLNHLQSIKPNWSIEQMKEELKVYSFRKEKLTNATDEDKWHIDHSKCQS